MKYIIFLFALISCSVTKSGPIVIKPDPEQQIPPQSPPLPPAVPMHDTVILYWQDTTSKGVNLKGFGAFGDGIHDDADAVQRACDYAILYKEPLIVPIGNFIMSHSILMQNAVAGRFFTIHMAGVLPNKSSSNEYLSRFTYTGRSGYAFGVQLARSVEIENISIIGQYTFPNTVNNYNIGTVKFADWQQTGITDSRYAPYAGIVIDPNQNASGSAGGSSDVTIRNCAIKQFMVGVALTPNPVTLNDEMINILDCDIETARVCVAIGQDQSKTIIIKGLKVWSSVHTILDGVTYGRGTGGGSVFCENWNIAGNVCQLFNLNADRFPLSCKDLYSESLFRIGNVGNGAGANFINCSIDFLTGDGMPAADYLIAGQANFSGGVLRYYDNSATNRMNLSNFTGMLRDMTLNTFPITIGLYGAPNPACKMDNVHMYYNQSGVTNKDSLMAFHTTPTLSIDRVSWTATITLPAEIAALAKVGDYILGTPGSQGRLAYDIYLNHANLNTIQVGRITVLSGTSAMLDDVSLNATPGISYDLMYLSKMK